MSVVESKTETTRVGGVTGRGFVPGQSGNPGGRPKGLARRVREAVGDDGEAIIQFMVTVMRDESARKADRIEAAKWLADRGFGRAIQGLEIDVGQNLALDLRAFSQDDKKSMLAILDKYDPHVDELAASGEIPFIVGPVEASGSRRR